MKLFVIHRFKDKKKAKAILKSIAKEISNDFSIVFLNSRGDDAWKSKAESYIDQCEAIIVFDRQACEESENSKWELEKAASKNKKIVDLQDGDNTTSIEKLRSLYEFEEEFEDCFSSNSDDTLIW